MLSKWNKPVVGVVLGAILGLLDGGTAWFTPEVRPFIQGIPWDLNGKQHVSPIFDIGAPRVVFGGTAQVLYDMLEVFAAAVGLPVPPTFLFCLEMDAPNPGALRDLLNIDIANNEIVRGTLTVQRSGNVVFNAYVPA